MISPTKISPPKANSRCLQVTSRCSEHVEIAKTTWNLTRNPPGRYKPEYIGA